MGIAGLLPLLKPIQVRRNLSEYSGQTIAVDAYVWLHKGAYACATELVTGKNTTKYVDYAMYRVRLLRHHRIEPYIVFDGGPLPAKKGTESERKKKREENLERANQLARQGKYLQARECYVKCIDVTPQMAYQLIKALRAESVPYVVAPYEADAQMTYLERIGLVDGILTEDSDLLVFGCKSVLFKLDATESTVTSISRVDFASLGASTAGGISLLGWSDVQFRAMAILSGCDYLPSIPGIGLKTAWGLLKKHKTVENVVRALKMEGKKNVPKGYLEAFRLAEKVFLHQRVYDPARKMLVYLTDVPQDEWDEEREAHVGGYIEPSLAKQIAGGDACPISLLPMKDINPTFVPRALKPIPMNSMSSATYDTIKGKGKARAHLSEKAHSTSIVNFFPPKPKAQTPVRSASQPNTVLGHTTADTGRTVAGRASGKRTLSGLMDEDIAAKRKKWGVVERPVSIIEHRTPTTSKFFGESWSTGKVKHPHRLSRDSTASDIPVAGPSRPASPDDKENFAFMGKDEEDDDIEISMRTQPDTVTQEDGYISPSPSLTRWDSTPELSSPVYTGGFSSRPTTTNGKQFGDDEDDFGAEVLSSPPAIRSSSIAVPGRKDRRKTRVPSEHRNPHDSQTTGRVLVFGSPTLSDQDNQEDARQRGRKVTPGPDLQGMFEDWGDLTSEIDEYVDDDDLSMESAVSSRGGPVTPEDSRAGREEIADVDHGDDEDEIILEDFEEESEMSKVEMRAIAAHTKVAQGWRKMWACDGMIGPDGYPKHGRPRRRETTITPEGRHKPLASKVSYGQFGTASAQPMQHNTRPASGKVATSGRRNRPSGPHALAKRRSGSSDYDGIEEISPSARNKLAGFRYLAG